MVRLKSLSSLLILLLIGVMGSGCAMRSELRDREQTIEDLRSQLESRSRRVEELKQERNQQEQRITELEERAKEREQQINQLEEEKTTLQNRIEELRSEREERLVELRSENRQLEEDLSEVKEATTRREDDNVIISLQSRILFDLGDHKLKPESRSTLDEIAEILREYHDRPVGVEGHTDTVPVVAGSRFPSNWHLSAARAVSVVEHLSQEQGVSPERLRAVGYGEKQPLKPNNSEDNRRLNRRVELVLYPSDIESRSLESDTDA